MQTPAGFPHAVLCFVGLVLLAKAIVDACYEVVNDCSEELDAAEAQLAEALQRPVGTLVPYSISQSTCQSCIWPELAGDALVLKLSPWHSH